MKKQLSSRQIASACVETLEDRRLLAGVALDFAGGAGGISNTGFTSVLATTYGKGLVSGNLSLSSGKLNVLSTAGDLWQTRNTQDNALGVTVDSASQDFVVQTTLTSTPFNANWTNGGIYVGTSEDNYVKLVAGYSGGQTIYMGSEAGGVYTTPASVSKSLAGITTLDLRLVGTAATKTLVAQYRINSTLDSAWVTIGQTTNAAVFNSAARAGVVTTNFGATPVTVSYDAFSFTQTGTVTPPPPPPPPPPSTGLTVGTNVNITRTAGNQVEAEIAVNPRNSNHLATVAVNQNGNNGYALMVSRSYDAGTTWQSIQLGTWQDGITGSTPRVDPHIAFDGFGNLYVTYMVAASYTEYRIIVAQSADGGASFTKTSAAFAGMGTGLDYPFIATGVDATNSARQSVWVGVTDTKAKRIKIVAATSAGLGQLSGWSARQTVSDSNGSYASAAVSATGAVAVTWQTSINRQNGTKIYVDVDADGLGTAKTFGRDVLASTSNVGGFDYITPQPDRSIDANMQVQWDKSSGPNRGRLYLVYADEMIDESNNIDIFLRSSNDNGATWSAARRVNDDTTKMAQFLPVLAVDPTTGYVGIAFHDCRNSPTNTGVQIYATVSKDGGLSFLPNVRVSAGTSYQAGANTANVDNLDFGDYTGLSFTNGRLNAIWADNSNTAGDNPDGAGSKFDLYTASIIVG